ncbi:DUF4350 domain-containing protein [Isoptericola sp. b441]|uniref:DUF4350 domain-containing protein n=1 Tax=Actinotalea lenta TaxID=3064654 RepID=A0ABT9DCG3_9CELL|nr:MULTISPECIES: DUF4350 domain-containing protein [unclassified Isoptericola]MDO8108585.1 DUF4350 domain-containing protein [Isoptericola sp. b441]MDO8119995.1 DUF4350 domain-containing protein [Isoptericola sp. b490]
MTDQSAPVRIGGERARTAAARRWRRWRLPLLIAVVLGISVLFSVLIRPDLSGDPLAINNPGPLGVRAVAQVLGRQGVHVTEVRSVDAAVAAAAAGTTLAVVETLPLDQADLERLARTPADLVVVDGTDRTLQELTDGAVANAWDHAPGVRYADCQDPDAVAARAVSSSDYALAALDTRATVCFADPGTPGTGSYAVLELGGRTVRVLADSAVLTNAHVTEAGNAALALRVLGKHDQLTWYRPTLLSPSTGAGTGIGVALPPFAGPVAAWLGLLVLVVALWRARAFGRVVTEPLPVTVRAAETTVGRGRLYRGARARGHAAAALRAGTARRAASRLGLARSADARTVIDALAGATGRPPAQVADLLYGPPPTDDAALRALARALDQLESEVHHT